MMEANRCLPLLQELHLLDAGFCLPLQLSPPDNKISFQYFPGPTLLCPVIRQGNTRLPTDGWSISSNLQLDLAQCCTFQNTFPIGYMVYEVCLWHQVKQYVSVLFLIDFSITPQFHPLMVERENKVSYVWL